MHRHHYYMINMRQRVFSSFHLQLTVREVELRALLSPKEDGVFDFALGEPEIQERLSQAAAGLRFTNSGALSAQ